MSKRDKHDSDTASTERIGTQKGITVLFLFWAIIGLIVLVAALLVAIWKVNASTSGGPELVENLTAKRLETAPQPELKKYMEEKTTLLNQYKWIDKEAGIASIPIEMAMDALSDASKTTTESARVNSQPSAPTPPPSPVEFKQNLGVQLPRRLKFVDQDNQPRQLAHYFDNDRRPIVLVLGYYQCPALCSTIMASMLQTVQSIKLPYRIVAVSIDPRETPDVALQQYAAYRPEKNDDAMSASGQEAETKNHADMHMLTGQSDAIATLAQYAGFGWKYDEASNQYTHPAGFLVLTPTGTVSRYFPGVSFNQRDLRMALIEASDARVGSLAERIILMCSHYDPLKGRYSLTVMAGVRAVGVLLVLALGVTLWRMHRRRRL